uniref:Uncharacterized protein n=1 Tax=Mycena chlorophos TaxID=658473 RepID=A0ABQ0L7I2_MYCCL|nr:predicted protein [Mycena chlorophos]
MDSYGSRTYAFDADLERRSAGCREDAVLKPQRLVHHWAAENDAIVLDRFVAVHVSECGSHLVALLASSRLVIIPFFHRIIRGETTLREIALDIQVGSPQKLSTYLAFENGRIGVATATGIYILSLDFGATVRTDGPIEIIATRAAWFNELLGLGNLACLQLGATGIYFNWPWRGSEILTRTNRGVRLRPDRDRETQYFASLSDERIVERWLPAGEDKAPGDRSAGRFTDPGILVWTRLLTVPLCLTNPVAVAVGDCGSLSAFSAAMVILDPAQVPARYPHRRHCAISTEDREDRAVPAISGGSAVDVLVRVRASVGKGSSPFALRSKTGDGVRNSLTSPVLCLSSR